MNLDNDQPIGVLELMEELAEVTNFTENHVYRNSDPYLAQIVKDGQNKQIRFFDT